MCSSRSPIVHFFSYIELPRERFFVKLFYTKRKKIANKFYLISLGAGREHFMITLDPLWGIHFIEISVMDDGIFGHERGRFLMENWHCLRQAGQYGHWTAVNLCTLSLHVQTAFLDVSFLSRIGPEYKLVNIFSPFCPV